jgi:hypothetical protein
MKKEENNEDIKHKEENNEEIKNKEREVKYSEQDSILKELSNKTNINITITSKKIFKQSGNIGSNIKKFNQ